MAKIITDENKIEELLTRGVDEVLVKESLKKKLLSGKKLRIKFGIDPTGSALHLGHAVILRKLKEFQDLGHQVIFLIGDFTARVGDPTGRSTERKILSDKDIKENMKSYAKQAGLLLNMKKVEVKYNSKWLSRLNFKELIELTSKVTYAQIAHRADFKERIKNDIDLSLQEFMYPIMQGYDSVELRDDVEIGGTDQKFNLLMGRQLQKGYGQAEQDIVTCPILEGVHGKEKMSKSMDNYIALTENPEDMYGKVMSIVDEMIVRYFELCAFSPKEKIDEIKKQLEGGKNPRDLKMELAREIVRIYHGEKSAKEAEDYFVKTIQKKEAPGKVESYKLKVMSMNIIDLLIEVKLASSKGEARRLIQQNGVKLDGKIVNDINQDIQATEKGTLLQRGKRRFVKIIKT